MIPFKQPADHLSVPLEKSGQTTSVEKLLWKILLISALAYFIWGDGVSISLGRLEIKKVEHPREKQAHKASFLGVLQEKPPVNRGVTIDSGKLDNLTCIIDPGYAERNDVSSAEVERRKNRCHAFIQKFTAVAIAEKRRYGVPASILLAQALLAGNAGRDPLSVKTNNFFHLPCHDTACEAEHLPEEKHSTEPVWVHTYASEWGSFRDQSLFLTGTQPYADMKGKSFAHWLTMFKKSGYSDDPLYAEKLGAIIHGLQLQDLDKR